MNMVLLQVVDQCLERSAITKFVSYVELQHPYLPYVNFNEFLRSRRTGGVRKLFSPKYCSNILAATCARTFNLRFSWQTLFRVEYPCRMNKVSVKARMTEMLQDTQPVLDFELNDNLIAARVLVASTVEYMIPCASVQS